MEPTVPLFQGVIPVLPTPFDDDEAVDLAALPRLVEFALACGATAVCLPAYGSEFYKLTDEERLALVGAAVEAAGGRLPVIAQANHGSAKHAASLAARMAGLGAAGVGLALPRQFAVTEPGLVRFAATVCRAVSVPVMIQDFNPGGGSVGAEFCRRLHERCPNFRAIKLEEAGLEVKAAAIGEATAGAVSVLEGWGGLYLCELDPRRVVGTIPGLSVTDALVEVRRRMLAGDADGAFALHAELVPYLTFTLRGMEFYHRPEKLTLQARGALANPRVRELTVTHEPAARAHYARLLARLEATFTAAGLSWRPLG